MFHAMQILLVNSALMIVLQMIILRINIYIHILESISNSKNILCVEVS